MYDFDSYLLYEVYKRDYYSIRIKVILNQEIEPEVLKSAAPKAFARFPYYRKKVAYDEKGGILLLDNDAQIVVTKDDHPIILGTAESNGLFFLVSYEDNVVYFNFCHNFCGACGAMWWVKATLWQYFKDLGYDLDPKGILTPDTPIDPAESALPDTSSLPLDEPLGNQEAPFEPFSPMSDYFDFMKNPNAIDGYYPLFIPKKDLMAFAKGNDGSPNSILSALLFKMCTRVFPEQKGFESRIACNYRAEVGCPNTHSDLVRTFPVYYRAEMKDWPIDKISTVTRTQMYLQMQPEYSFQWHREVEAFRKQIDALEGIEAKSDFALKNSPVVRAGAKSTFCVSYVGKIDWGDLAPFLKGVFTITPGNIMLEVNATEKDFCISFQTVRQDGEYIKEFLKLLDEEGISYEAGEYQNRKRPKTLLRM